MLRVMEADRLNQLADVLSSHTPGERLPLSVRYMAARLADEYVTHYLELHERWTTEYDARHKEPIS